MRLKFLPPEIRAATDKLDYSMISEIRLRCGQPVIIEYCGEYKYIDGQGVTDKRRCALLCESAENVLYSAVDGSIYAYTEQLKHGFITVEGGVRIGIGGEYVVEGDKIVTVKNVTSLNIRIPHEIEGCANLIYDLLDKEARKNALVFSPPGYGKTTILRDLASSFSKRNMFNVLVFDERNELSGIDGEGKSFASVAACDVVRGADKLTAFPNAIRTMKPQVIITDELYGERDMLAVKYAVECGIRVIASTHVTDRKILSSMPFDIYVELSGIGKRVIVYDKNFNTLRDSDSVGRIGGGNIS